MTNAETVRRRLRELNAELMSVMVTGTNGKSTTTSMIDAIVAASGERSSRIDTFGCWLDGGLMTSDVSAEACTETIEQAIRNGVRTLVLEVTSKSLLRGIASVWPPDVAVFTNLSPDHLELHGGVEEYFLAKKRLFQELRSGGCAVLNHEDEYFGRLVKALAPRVRVFEFFPGLSKLVIDGQTFDVTHAPPRASTMWLSMNGRTHATRRDIILRSSAEVDFDNALAAMSAARALGYSWSAIQAGLEQFRPLPGRFQVLQTSPTIVIDNATNPASLNRTLREARRLAARHGRLILVFGCGGFPADSWIRPMMGQVADELADTVIVTTDNPRFERAERIEEMVRSAVTTPRADWHSEPDRRRAVSLAVELSNMGSCVVLAGKGGEDYQEVNGERYPYSDVDSVSRLGGPVWS
jgi:UDP-N-acetylmuramoyl-L-alanyl-D-glutamate--2,6-diaminopimelate ligase